MQKDSRRTEFISPGYDSALGCDKRMNRQTDTKTEQRQLIRAIALQQWRHFSISLGVSVIQRGVQSM